MGARARGLEGVRQLRPARARAHAPLRTLRQVHLCPGPPLLLPRPLRRPDQHEVLPRLLLLRLRRMLRRRQGPLQRHEIL